MILLPLSPKLFKRLLKIIVLAYIYQLAKFGDFMLCGSKDIFKNAPCLMAYLRSYCLVAEVPFILSYDREKQFCL